MSEVPNLKLVRWMFFFISWQKSSGKHFGMNNEAVFNCIKLTAESMPAQGINQPSRYLN